jgi:hypothetical protein
MRLGSGERLNEDFFNHEKHEFHEKRLDNWIIQSLETHPNFLVICVF